MSESVTENNNNDKGHSPNLETMNGRTSPFKSTRVFIKEPTLTCIAKEAAVRRLNEILNYLEESNKIAYDRDGAVLWIFTYGPKVERLERESVRLK